MPLVSDRARVAGIADQLHDFRVGPETLEIGMDEDVSELAGQPLVLFNAQLLLPEKDNAMLQQRLADSGHGGVVQFPGQLNVRQFGAQRTGKGVRLQLFVRHGFSPDAALSRASRIRRARS